MMIQQLGMYNLYDVVIVSKRNVWSDAISNDILNFTQTVLTQVPTSSDEKIPS